MYHCDFSVKRLKVEIFLKNQNFHGRVGPLTQEFKQTGINRVLVLSSLFTTSSRKFPLPPLKGFKCSKPLPTKPKCHKNSYYCDLSAK